MLVERLRNCIIVSELNSLCYTRSNFILRYFRDARLRFVLLNYSYSYRLFTSFSYVLLRLGELVSEAKAAAKAVVLEKSELVFEFAELRRVWMIYFTSLNCSAIRLQIDNDLFA